MTQTTAKTRRFQARKPGRKALQLGFDFLAPRPGYPDTMTLEQIRAMNEAKKANGEPASSPPPHVPRLSESRK